MGEAAEVVGVGDARLVRTFRVGADGRLFPVNTATAWTTGWNHATCGRGRAHIPPDPDCRCGFYVYSDPAYTLAQPPARQVMAIVAVHGAMEAGTRGARVNEAKIEAIWLGPRVSSDLEAAIRAQYPAVLIYRNRATMFADLPLTQLPGFKAPRLGERARRWLRTYLLVFLAIAAVVGGLPMQTQTADTTRVALWVAVLAGAAAITIGGAIVRSSMVTFVGITAVAWMVTAESLSTTGGIIYRGLVLLVGAWVGLIWWRAATPGRPIHDARVDSAVRRWRATLLRPR
jgi:hypothetical protein